MKPTVLAVVSIILLAWIGAARAMNMQDQPSLPPGHPALPAPTPQPITEDVHAPINVMRAYYASISGPAGTPRDWERFQSLFLPGAHLATLVGAEEPAALLLTPARFVEMNRRYFEVGGYFERSIHEEVRTFGRIAHVFSTYEARRHATDAPYSRGVTSFQMIESDGRWSILSVTWDRERTGVVLTEDLLPRGHEEPE